MPVLNSPQEIAVLDAPEDIQVLLDPRQRAALLPFMGREASVSQAAKEVCELRNTMLKRVQRWLAKGLLVETNRVPHAKGSMALYRTRADAFFVPHHATPAEDLLALTSQIYVPMFADFLQSYVRSGEQLSGDWGLRFERINQQWWVRPAKSVDDRCEPTDAGLPASLLDVDVLLLNLQDAKSLQRELRAVVQKYKKRSVPEGQMHKVVLGMARMV